MNLLLAIASFWITSIYSLQLTNVDGNTVSMNNFRNKKILLVNIATSSSKVGQLAGLQQLQQLYGDSVVILAFPSNSFGKENRANAAIKQVCKNNYGVTFTIAAKNDVTGANMQPIYKWLARQSENGVMDLSVAGNFQKILIGKDGGIIGVFAPSVDPMDVIIRNALTGN